MKFWLTVSTNGVSTRLYHKWNNFCLLWFRLGCAWIRLAEKFLQKWRWFFFFVVATRLSNKTMCTVIAKQHNCRFFVLKRNIQNVAAGLALFTVVETSRFIGWKVNTFFYFYLLDITHLQESLVFWCPPTILSFYIWLIEMRH